MKPFDAPANANMPAASPLLWFQLPMASYAAAMDIAGYQVRYWAAFQQAALNLSQGVWRALPAASLDVIDREPSPMVACTAADLRSAGAAVIQAQMDAMEALRRSA